MNKISFRMIIYLLFLILLNGHFPAAADVILPASGIVAKYLCSEGPGKVLDIHYWSEKKGEIVYREVWDNLGDNEIGEVDGLSRPWEYLMGISQSWVMNRGLHTLKMTKGNFDKIDSLTEGEYVGQFSIKRMQKSHLSQATVHVGKAKQVNSAMGRLKAIPIETKIDDIDGHGNILTISSVYSPTFRLFLSRRIHGPLGQRIPRSTCELSGLNPSNGTNQGGKEIYFEWPEVNTTTNYRCTGSISKMTIKVVKNSGDKVLLRILDSRGSFSLEGSPAQIYLGLGSEASEDRMPHQQLGLNYLNLASLGENILHPSQILMHSWQGKFKLTSTEGKNQLIEGDFFSTLHNFDLKPSLRHFNTKNAVIPLVRVRTAISFNNTEIYQQFAYTKDQKAPAFIARHAFVGGKPQSYSCQYAR